VAAAGPARAYSCCPFPLRRCGQGTPRTRRGSAIPNVSTGESLEISIVVCTIIGHEQVRSRWLGAQQLPGSSVRRRLTVGPISAWTTGCGLVGVIVTCFDSTSV
jgi:hypothetical protein